MSVYLGRNKVGVSYKKTSGNEIDSETLNNLNDAVNYRIGEFDTKDIPQMITALKKNYFQAREYDMFTSFDNNHWVRPQEWPDLDSLNLQMEGNDFIYMTYDNTRGRAAVAWHIEKTSNGADINVEIGHVINGVYTPYDTISDSSNNYVRWLDNTIDGDYPVIRITGDIYRCYSYNVTQDGATQHYRRQPVIERIAYVPHLQSFCLGYSTNAWGLFTLQREKIANGDGTALTSLYYAWAYCRELQDFDISGLKTPNVTTMDSAFRQLLKIRTLDLHHLTVNKVTNFSYAFEGNKALAELNLEGWKTNAGVNFSSMFASCFSLTEIKGIENFNTSQATNFSSFFNGCHSILSLDLSSWDTEKVTNLSSCFSNCQSIIELNLSTWNVNKVTSLNSTFSYCYCLKQLNTDGWQIGALTTIVSMYAYCWSLEKINTSWLEITNKCTNIYNAFFQCYSLKELNLPDWDVSGLSSTSNTANSVFSNCWSLEKITGIKDWQFHLTNSIASIFNNCYCLKELDVSGWRVNTVTSLVSCFTNCISLKNLDLSNWQPEKCTSFASMFSGCHSLVSVGDIGDWDISNATTLDSMFKSCYSLEELPNVQNWNYSKVTNMNNIFYECTSLKQVIWRNISLPVCTTMNTILRYNYNLQYVDLSGWSIPSVTNQTSANAYSHLGDCSTLQDVIGFPIPPNYTHIGFANCENLSHQSLLNILNSLPQVSSTHTVHITAIVANTLTTTEKAIATNKGWTIAA